MSTTPFDIIELITKSEHHFNDLCFKIRALASTWLLATFAAVGFLIKGKLTCVIPRETLVIMLCWGSAIGISVLWILDIQIYQKLLNAWFDARKEIEEENANLPNIRDRIKATQPGGRATNLLKIYYMVTCSAPLFFGFIMSVKMLEDGDKIVDDPLCRLSLFFLLALNLIIFFLSPRDERSDGAGKR